MIRRCIVPALLFVLFVAVAMSHAADRNVILIVGDAHGMQAGCCGDPVIKTPALDRMAARGTRFTNGFAAVSSCSPSRAVILTGTYNHRNGQYGLAHSDHNFHSRKNTASLPKLLKDAGYRTSVIGKLHVIPPEVYPFDDERPGASGKNDAFSIAKAVQSYLAEAADKPFFLLVGFHEPHRAGKGFGNDGKGKGGTPYDPKAVPVPSWLTDMPEVRAELAEYYQAIGRMDQGIGMILDTVRESGRDKDTLIIYLSDNGPPFPGAKTTLYEPGIHLPLIVCSPAHKQGSVVNRAMVSWVDIAPTILEWVKVKTPQSMDGRSLMPILGQADPSGWDTVYGSHTFHEVTMYYPTRMIRTRKHKYILNLAHELEYPFASDLWGSQTWQAVLKRGDSRYGLRSVQDLLHRPKEELYDLESDPDETKNVASDPRYAEVLSDLRRRLRDWQKSTRDPWVIKYEHE